MSDKVDRLLPGQTRDIPLDPVPAGSTAEVTAVILQDGTAVGDVCFEELRGGGCDTTSLPVGWLALLVPLGLRRRRPGR